MRRRVAVIGGGNGARTAAVEFAIAGHDVVIYELAAFRAGLRGIADSGAIRATGAVEGIGPVSVADDPAVAVEGSDLILIVVPTNHHLTIARELAPVLADGMNVALMPGSLGSLEFAAYLQRTGSRADVTVSEFAALPYATRISGPNEVHVFGRRKFVSFATFPAQATDRVRPIIEDLYPGVETMRNVLEAGLNNPNPTLHCLGVLLSASRIEYSHGEFYYYEEGLTPHVCHAVEAIDAERLAIGRTLGLEILSLKDTYPKMGYGPSGETFWSVIRGVEVLHDIKGPTQIDNRYLTEDVPTGLNIYSQLGRSLGLQPRLMESVITLAGALLSRDFAAEGRSLESCGIAGLDRDALLEYVQTGHRR